MSPNAVGLSSYDVGDIRLTLIPDGYHRCDPLATFGGSTPDDWAAHSHLLDDHGRVVMTMGALLVELPSGERVLVDLGFGPRTVILAELGMEFWGGRMLTSLRAVGIAPADIDVVVYSHLHSDHVGLDDRPRATTRSPSTRASAPHGTREWEHWQDKAGTGGPDALDLAALEARVELVDGEAAVRRASR